MVRYSFLFIFILKLPKWFVDFRICCISNSPKKSILMIAMIFDYFQNRLGCWIPWNHSHSNNRRKTPNPQLKRLINNHRQEVFCSVLFSSIQFLGIYVRNKWLHIFVSYINKWKFIPKMYNKFFGYKLSKFSASI